MSLSSEKMLTLMAYADGELEGPESVAERKEAERLLASDPDSARFVENIAGLGDVVAMGHGARSGKTIAKFDIADAVMSSVSSSDASRVVSISAAREKSEKKKGSSGLKVMGGVAAVLALAASVFVFTQHRSEETPMAKAPIAVPAAPSDVSSETVGAGVDVHTLNSPGQSVSVFYLPNTANEMASSLVVWVDETGDR